MMRKLSGVKRLAPALMGLPLCAIADLKLNAFKRNAQMDMVYVSHKSQPR
jgi:hypothetical protein